MEEKLDKAVLDELYRLAKQVQGMKNDSVMRREVKRRFQNIFDSYYDQIVPMLIRAVEGSDASKAVEEAFKKKAKEARELNEKVAELEAKIAEMTKDEKPAKK